VFPVKYELGFYILGDKTFFMLFSECQFTWLGRKTEFLKFFPPSEYTYVIEEGTKRMKTMIRYKVSNI
jgi:hypothetical protein